MQMDVEDSWKGRLWFIYFMWPFFIFGYCSNFHTPDTAWEITLAIFLFLGSIGWLIMTRYLYKTLREIFKREDE